MQFLWLYIDELVGKGLSFGVIIEFLLWGSATLFPYALPLATLLASIMTMGAMGENNELLAMKAAGISLQRIIAPLVILSFFISIAAFFASNDLKPHAYLKIYSLRDDVRDTKEEIKIPVGIFYNGVEDYTIRIESRDKRNVMHNIMVYNHSKGNGNVSLTIADSGKVKLTPDKSSILFTLYNGINYEEDNVKNYNDTSLTLQQIKFTMQEVVIPLENYDFKKSDDSRYADAIMAKDLKQLNKDEDSLSVLYDNTLSNQVYKSLNSNKLKYTSQIDTQHL
jgi:Predicted permeases